MEGNGTIWREKDRDKSSIERSEVADTFVLGAWRKSSLYRTIISYIMEKRVGMKGVTDADRKNDADDAEVRQRVGHVEQWREDVRRLLLVVEMSTTEALDCTVLNVANFANNGSCLGSAESEGWNSTWPGKGTLTACDLCLIGRI